MEPDQREQRIRQLEARVRSLEEQVSWQGWVLQQAQGASGSPPHGWQQTTPRAPSQAGPAPPAGNAPWQPLPPFPAEGAARPMPAAPAMSAMPAMHPPARPRPINVETLLGANWLARAGILVLALGVVFFLKLAYDRGWVPIPGRFAIGTLGGLAIFALGDVLRGRKLQPAFLQVLAAGGAVIAYITVYMAYLLPEYRAAIGITLAGEVAMLAGISLLLGCYALWRDLPVLAGVAAALAGILVAPAGDLSNLGVTVVALLCTAMLLASIWRRWSAILLSTGFVANIAFLVASAGLHRHVDWAVLAACAAVTNATLVVAAHRAAGAGSVRRAVASVWAGVALFLVLGLSFDRAPGLAKPWALAAAAVAMPSLAAGPASRRVGPALAAVGAVAALAWPVLQFDAPLAQGWSYAAMAAGAGAASLALPRSAAWVRLGATAALACGILALNQQSAKAIHAAAVESGLLASALFIAGAGLWALALREAAATRALRTGEDADAHALRWRPVPSGPGALGTALVPLAVVAVHAAAWPHRQFEGTLWAPFTLAVVAGLLLAAQAAWPPQRRTFGAVVAGLGASAILSLLWLGSHGNVLKAQAGAGAGVAALLAAAGVLTFVLQRRAGTGDPLRVAGLALAAAAPMVELAYLLDGWQITVAWAAEALVAAFLGLWLRALDLRIASFALFAAVLLRVFTVDFSTLDVVSRVLAFIFTGAILLLGAFLYARQRAGPGGAGGGPARPSS